MKNNICPCCLHRDRVSASYCVICGAKMHPNVAVVNFAIELSSLLAKAIWGLLIIFMACSIFHSCTSGPRKLTPREEEARNLDYALKFCYVTKDYDNAYERAARIQNPKVREAVERLIGIERLKDRWDNERRRILNNEDL